MDGERADLAAALLGSAEARRLTDQVKRDARDLWRRLNDLYERSAHLALHYASWDDYCAEEFGIGKAHAYRLLAAARTLDEIEAQSPDGDSLPTNEAQARELARADDPAAAWRQAQQAHGSNPSASKIHDTIEGRSRRVYGLTQSPEGRQEAATPPPARGASGAAEALHGRPRRSDEALEQAAAKLAALALAYEREVGSIGPEAFAALRWLIAYDDEAYGWARCAWMNPLDTGCKSAPSRRMKIPQIANF
jgi:hypothetical protein